MPITWKSLDESTFALSYCFVFTYLILVMVILLPGVHTHFPLMDIILAFSCTILTHNRQHSLVNGIKCDYMYLYPSIMQCTYGSRNRNEWKKSKVFLAISRWLAVIKWKLFSFPSFFLFFVLLLPVSHTLQLGGGKRAHVQKRWRKKEFRDR